MSDKFEAIGFIRSGFNAIAYGRLYLYLCRMVIMFHLPHVEVADSTELSKLTKSTLVLVPWDLFTHGGGVPSLPNVKYVLLVFEPLKNIEEWVEQRGEQFISDNFLAFINLVEELNPWFENVFPGKPLFRFHQGYVSYEECGRSNSNDMDIDVILPGHCFGPDRPEITKQLRETGLMVFDDMIVGDNLNNYYNRSKVCAYYPYGPEYTAWHGQRTLWAINKGVCCVGVESEDKESERLYKGLYVSCSRSDFVSTVVQVIESGEWKQKGEDAFHRYKRDFDGFRMFDRHLIEFLWFKVTKMERSEALPMFKVFMHEDATRLATEVLQSGYLTQGPKVQEFETGLASFFDISPRRLTTVNSATTGLTLALAMLKDPMNELNWPGFDQQENYVLTSPLTCTATNWAVLANDYKLQWVDTNLHSPNIDLDDLERKLTKHSKIILFVHWGGIPVELDKLSKCLDRFEKKHAFRPMVIEDCAHAFGSKYNGKKIGTHGNICVFSFQAIKQLTTADGGLVIWPNEQMANRAKRLRWFGIDRDAHINGPDFRNRESTDIKEFGYKWHMNDLNAAIGIGNLKHIQSIIDRETHNFQWLYDHIRQFDPAQRVYQNVVIVSNSDICGWIFTILLANDHIRTLFLKHMTKYKIQSTQVHFRNDIHSCTFPNLISHVPLPHLDELASRYVCIPCGWWLTENDLASILQVLVIFANINY